MSKINVRQVEVSLTAGNDDSLEEIVGRGGLVKNENAKKLSDKRGETRGQRKDKSNRPGREKSLLPLNIENEGGNTEMKKNTDQSQEKQPKEQTPQTPQNPFYEAIDCALQSEENESRQLLEEKLVILDPRSRSEVFNVIATWVIDGKPMKDRNQALPLPPSPLFAVARAAAKLAKTEDAAAWQKGLIGHAYNVMALRRALQAAKPPILASQMVTWEYGDGKPLVRYTRNQQKRYSVTAEAIKGWVAKFQELGYSASCQILDEHLARAESNRRNRLKKAGSQSLETESKIGK